MDTGHHFDLSRSVLSDFGFSESAIKICQVANWLTDYFSYSPTTVLDPMVSEELKKLHFDNLFSSDDIRSYWTTLILNAHNGFLEHSHDRNHWACLALLGISLHTIQDFYSHSNWCDFFRPPASDCLRKDDWFFHQGDIPKGLKTGAYPTGNGPDAHGDYHGGMNKDSYVRPQWLEAYGAAYCSGHHWAQSVQAWLESASPGFWQQLLTFDVNDAERSLIELDVSAAIGISMWIHAENKNGLWKGYGSGDSALFSGMLAKWLPVDSPTVQLIRDTHLAHQLAQNLYARVPASTLPEIVESRRLRSLAVLVRTTKVRDEQPWYDPMDIESHPDFFAKIRIGNQMFLESVQQDQSEISPSWTSVAFFDSSTKAVPIEYRLFDEDIDEDDVCDISPHQGRSHLDLTFDLQTETVSGDLNGIFNSSNNSFRSTGSGGDDRATIEGFIRTIRLTTVESSWITDSNVECLAGGSVLIHITVNGRHLIIEGVPSSHALAVASATAKSRPVLIAWYNRQAGGSDHDKAVFSHLVIK